MLTARRTPVALVLFGAVAFAPSAAAIVPPPVSLATIHTVCASGCDFTTIQGAIDDPATVAGDAVRVSPGTYAEQVVLNKQLTVEGRPGETPPVIISSGTLQETFKVAAGGAGSTLQHLDLRATGPTGTALNAIPGAVASDLTLTATAECAILGGSSQFGPGITATATGATASCIDGIGPAVLLHGLTVSAPGSSAFGVTVTDGAGVTDSTVSASTALRIHNGGTARRGTFNGVGNGIATDGTGPSLISDSIATSTEFGGSAVVAMPNIVTVATATTILRNVTVIAGGGASTGIEAQNFGGAVGPDAIDAKNVIARGANADVAADVAVSPCPVSTCGSGAVTISHSNFATTRGVVLEPVPSANQSLDPLFVNGAVGPAEDFHIAFADSPLIGAGTPDPSNGPTDRDGRPHLNPPSIGAYEPLPGLPTSRAGTGTGGGPTGGGAPGGGGTPSGGGAPDGSGTVVATVSQLKLSPASFVAAQTGSSALAARKPRTGTIVSYTLNEPARVRFTVVARKPGRRTSRGRCVTPTKANRHAVACTRLVALKGSFTRASLASTNRFRFTGRLSSQTLKPGGYRLIATPTLNGRTGRAASAPFRITS